LSVGSVVIDTEFDRKDYSSSPATAIRKSWNHLMPELIPNQIKRMVKEEKFIVIA
jgi:hypothetical protein